MYQMAGMYYYSIWINIQLNEFAAANQEFDLLNIIPKLIIKV